MDDATKADDRRTIKWADFVGRFYRTTKKSADFCMSHDRFYRPMLSADISAINLAAELGCNFAEKIGR